MGRLLPFLHGGPASADIDEVANATASVVEAVREGRHPFEEGRVQLNEVQRGFTQTRWWGQLRELLEADLDFAREVRAWSRGDDVAEDSPVTQEDRARFVESLREWGI